MASLAVAPRLGRCCGPLESRSRLAQQRLTILVPQRASRSTPARLCVHAKLRRRLLSYILSAPQRSERYFESSAWRRWMWAGISLCTGFYAGNILTLSFGALAVNDIFAGVIVVLFYEVVTHLYYSSFKPSLRVWFANCFKIGLTASLLADAAKLGS